MAKQKSKKIVVPKFEIPEGSHAINPFYCELRELYLIIEECEQRKLNSLKIALKKIHKDISDKRDHYQWIEPK
jgi:hypothetical protein